MSSIRLHETHETTVAGNQGDSNIVQSDKALKRVGHEAGVLSTINSISDSFLPSLSRCLSGPVLREIHHNGTSKYLSACLSESGIRDILDPTAPLLSVLVGVFAAMRRSYRVEYVYRSAITSNIFFGRHSPRTTVLLPELRASASRADLVMLNGTSWAYEIKTEFDGFARLKSQVSDYSRVFDKISVVTSPSLVERVLGTVPAHVGVLSLTQRFRLSVVKPPTSNACNVDVAAALLTLRLCEIRRITEKICGSVPAVGTAHMFDTCRDWLARSASPRAVHDGIVSELKGRQTISPSDVVGLAPELLPALIESGLRSSQWRGVVEYLETAAVGDIQ